MSTERLQQALAAVPFLGTLSLRVDQAQPGSVVMSLNQNPSLLDHAGHVHSSALFALGESAAAVALGTHPALETRTQLQHACGIRYFKACAGSPSAKAHIDLEQIHQIEEELSASGMAKTEVIVSIENDKAEQLAEVIAVFSIQ